MGNGLTISDDSHLSPGQNQEVLVCPENEGSQFCVSAQQAQANSDVSFFCRHELFRLKSSFVDEENFSELSHYQKERQSWETFDFDHRNLIPILASSPLVTVRRPQQVQCQHSGIYISMQDGSVDRATVYEQEMVFVPHQRQVNTGDIYSGLRFIAAIDNRKGGMGWTFYPPEDQHSGPAFLDTHVKKDQALTWLRTKSATVTDQAEKNRLAQTILKLEQHLEDDEIVFLPVATPEVTGEGNAPYLETYRYDRITKVYIGNFENFNHITIPISEKQWNYVVEPFDRASPSSADKEREALQESLKRWELVLASQTSLGFDFGAALGNGLELLPRFVPLPPHFGYQFGQTRCYHEALNVYELVVKLQRSGRLVYHELPETREIVPYAANTIHVATALREKESGQWYVIDSWVRGAGYPPLIMKAEHWNANVEDSFAVPYNLSSAVVPTQESLSQASLESRYFLSSFGVLSSTVYGSWKIHRGISRSALSFQESSLRYMGTPQGYLNTSLLLLSVLGLLSTMTADEPDGVPEPGDDDGFDIGESWAWVTSALFYAAEGRTALQLSHQPFLYEAPLVYSLYVLGSGTAGEAAEIGAHITGIESFSEGGTLHLWSRLFGGMGLIQFVRSYIGAEILAGTSQTINRFLVNTIGRAGMAVEEAVAALVTGACSVLGAAGAVMISLPVTIDYSAYDQSFREAGAIDVRNSEA